MVHRNQISLGKDSLGTSFVYVFRAESVATGVRLVNFSFYYNSRNNQSE